MTQHSDELLASLTHALLERAAHHGADAADAIAVKGTSVSIDVRERALEHADRSEGADIGLRVFVGQKQANVSASDISTSTIDTMAERAVAMAREAPDDPYAGLADAADLAKDWDIAALELSDPGGDPSAEDLQSQALRAEEAARSVAGVTQVEKAITAFDRRQVHLATSNGFSGGYNRSNFGISVSAICGEGTAMERDYSGDSRTYAADMRSPEEIGAEAGHRATERVGARKPPTGAFPVLFDERISASLIGHLLSAINGVSISRGSSWLRDDMGAQVLPKGLSIYENPHRPRAMASRAFDAEGLATQARFLVENGVLQSWTLDLATARKLGMTSTANASRGTKSAPSPSVTNIELTQGTASRSDLIAQMGTGLLVTSMIGATINPNTGDYSRGAAGLWVENGEITHPVNECTIAGNLRDMLRDVTPANDARAHLSRVVPSLLVSGMTIAGA
ncbi:MAG: TldD/PmbA family protein [Rhodobacteraceae bacterium]|nr:TldD/PmbA family protein [Paracoccaceae bacterium]